MKMCSVGGEWVRFSFLFLLSDQHFYMVKNILYIHISASVEIVYELQLLPQNTASEYFDIYRERCEVLTGYVFIIGVPAWR